MENTIKNLVNSACLTMGLTAPSYKLQAKSKTTLDNLYDRVIIRSYDLTTTSLLNHMNRRL